MALATLPVIPTVLCGPIVRRAEPDRVYIWLATSEPLDQPELTLHNVVTQRRGSALLGPRLNTQSQTTSIKLGTRLWVHLLRAPGGAPLPSASGQSAATDDVKLPTNALLAYNIVEASGRRRDLSALMSIGSVVLTGMPLPTFILQGPQPNTHLLYASCRKLHGAGTDNAPVFERLLQRWGQEPKQRMQTLLLGGDQIYADDVSDIIIKHLGALGAELLGRDEQLPGVPHPESLPLHGRMPLIHREAKMTSGEAENHLLTLGEWISTYLLAWNPDLWPTRLPTVGEAWGELDHRQRPPAATWVGHYTEQLRLVEDAKQGSSAMRRVLANIATYMVFDDHEITDDWNLNVGWEKAVRASGLGRRILLNGMAAYWMFQGWGNEPTNFDDSFLASVATYMSSGNGADDALRAIDSHPDWGFTAPTTPRTVVLDTRTRRGQTRGYDITGGELLPRTPNAPRLLNAEARGTVRRRLATATKVHRAVIVLAPSPVWGLEDIETVLRPAGYISAASVDFESWSANPRSRVDLMQMTQDLRIRPLVILSGDVHYGFSVAVRSSSKDNETFYAQFCSSATKNQSGGKLAFALKVAGYELPHPGTKTWMWLEGGDDGPTRTVTLDPIAMLNPQHAAKVLRDFTINRALLGEPAWTERRAYNAISSSLQGLISSVEVQRNNIGELWMDGEAMVHRHWQLDGSNLRVVSGLRWSPGDWPA